MDLQPEAVARPVHEALAVTGRGDHVARGAVDFLARHAGGEGGDRGVVRGEDDRVGLLDLGWRSRAGRARA